MLAFTGAWFVCGEYGGSFVFGEDANVGCVRVVEGAVLSRGVHCVVPDGVGPMGFDLICAVVMMTLLFFKTMSRRVSNVCGFFLAVGVGFSFS